MLSEARTALDRWIGPDDLVKAFLLSAMRRRPARFFFCFETVFMSVCHMSDLRCESGSWIATDETVSGPSIGP